MKTIKQLALVVLLAIAGSHVQAAVDYQVIPLPNSIQLQAGASFELTPGVPVYYPKKNGAMQRNAQYLSAYLRDALGSESAIKTGNGKTGIHLMIDSSVQHPEGYTLTVNSKGVTIAGSTAAGVFYGIQTLRKSLPFESKGKVALPAVIIQDAPRFGYRGMMLDASRHFETVENVKKFIDMLVLHNVNIFHWHLTDDQGWRVEIKKYPGLTEIGSKRKETVIGRNTGKYDGKPHEGFYTQDELRAIVKYAQERYITIIPEIDMPGHMLGALAAYPELGCTGGPYEVWTIWGVSDNVLCIGNDKTLQFMEDVLAEVLQIFPSEYIHIGGDECPKTRWKECSKCQARIREQGLEADEHHSAEDRLQSFAITHAEKFLNKNGRRLIGWDEILEGGLAPNATVMSWRGMGGGIEAAKQGHDVIMTPNSPLYFDHYQTKDVDQEPLAIGGYSPVEMVYNFNPLPSQLTAEQQKRILGVQANVWREYMPVFSHVQYMVLPRMAALAEVQWMQPEKKNYEAFQKRLLPMMKRYEFHRYNYAKHLFDITADFKPNPSKGTLDITMSTIDNAPIHYTLDGTVPTKSSPVYSPVLQLKKDAEISAVVIRGNEKSRMLTERVALSKASLKPIRAIQPINRQYRYNGASVLVDGLRGNSNYKTGRWIAVAGNDLEVIIDFEQATEFTNASITCNVVNGDWIFDARSFAVEVSNDGETFTRVAGEEYPATAGQVESGIYAHELNFIPVKARYVKVIAGSERSIPDWHGGRGRSGFLFVDEIVLN
jgi:hexosaminidase